ncbi:General stress protein 26 [Georgenia satyanarayanai]|uniref:General stress protein 26 n=1 Tax=Georgenia satyanarayanai TaxID=860221 RepID=A0A2Y9AR29_9MICO|nr:pyridoxamine 5'-phosphate oxidase family protein [Georgenia satyanarayanai]PYF98356.1 general stress protein 26 [Georgenia satyanarayanai]SSA44947.1 General stress protein 26 [Georgenia satyanarayanai]
MRETADEVAAMQALMDASYARSTSHLREIVSGPRRLTAEQVLAELVGMKVLTLATVTAAGEPRLSAVDGHLLHGSWTFGTDGRAAKATHLAARPAVSAAHVDGERLGVFCHGRAVRLTPADPLWTETIEHWTAHYGPDPTTWGADVRMFRVEPTWLVGYGTVA